MPEASDCVPCRVFVPVYRTFVAGKRWYGTAMTVVIGILLCAVLEPTTACVCRRVSSSATVGTYRERQPLIGEHGGVATEEL
jgi:hypothetical protein